MHRPTLFAVFRQRKSGFLGNGGPQDVERNFSLLIVQFHTNPTDTQRWFRPPRAHGDLVQDRSVRFPEVLLLFIAWQWFDVRRFDTPEWRSVAGGYVAGMAVVAAIVLASALADDSAAAAGGVGVECQSRM